VTDANLVLGRLLPDAFLGGAMQLDVAAARQAVARLAARMGVAIEAAAAGVVAIANEHMAQALRVISVQRGVDPRNFVLVSFGGAGGLHVCALAEALGMARALVPVHAGVLSAFGMLVAPPSRQLSHTLNGVLEAVGAAAIEAALQTLAAQGRAELLSEGVDAAAIATTYSLDLRYQGQSYTLNLSWQGLADTRAAFESLHARRYGHRLDAPVELVTVRCGLQGRALDVQLPPLAAGSGAEPRQTAVAGHARPVPVHARSELRAGQRFAGPALVTETVATTWLPAGWSCTVDEVGNLLLERE
jgi:N-methylhydantoinase A